MHGIARSALVFLAALVLILPMSVAQADESTEGDVDIPAPRKAAPPPPAPMAEEPVGAFPPAFVSLASTTVALGVGVSWGEGNLSYEGINHAFSVRGLKLLDIGVSVTEGFGDVRNLEKLSDFEGTYVAVEAAGAAGIGRSASSMRNEHGVEISLRSELKGVELALATKGVSISFK
jgi:hypothetical protein